MVNNVREQFILTDYKTGEDHGLWENHCIHELTIIMISVSLTFNHTVKMEIWSGWEGRSRVGLERQFGLNSHTSRDLFCITFLQEIPTKCTQTRPSVDVKTI
jgi:hypothetical protein